MTKREFIVGIGVALLAKPLAAVAGLFKKDELEGPLIKVDGRTYKPSGKWVNYSEEYVHGVDMADSESSALVYRKMRAAYERSEPWRCALRQARQLGDDGMIYCGPGGMYRLSADGRIECLTVKRREYAGDLLPTRADLMEYMKI